MIEMMKMMEMMEMIEEVSSVCQAKGIEVNELGVWLPGRLLNVSLMMRKGIEAYL
jgi:hypothetical protein